MNYAADIAYAKLCQEVYNAPDTELYLDGIGGHFAWTWRKIDDRLVLCFRGSKRWLDWLADLVAFPLFSLNTVHDLRLGPVHAGFLVGAQYVLPEVRQLLSDGQYLEPFVLVGHSLGGALATVLAGLLAASGSPPVEVVTFGSPRAGMQPLVTLLQSVAIRQYVFGSDPVPHVPTNPPFIHVRQPLLHLGKPLQSLLSNHHITNYIGALTELSNGPQQTAVAG